MLKKQKAHYEVNIWFERDRSSIVVYNMNGRAIAAWQDDDVQDMFENGFFVSGRGNNKLAESVLKYLQDIGVIRAKTYTYDVV